MVNELIIKCVDESSSRPPADHTAAHNARQPYRPIPTGGGGNGGSGGSGGGGNGSAGGGAQPLPVAKPPTTPDPNFPQAKRIATPKTIDGVDLDIFQTLKKQTDAMAAKEVAATEKRMQGLANMGMGFGQLGQGGKSAGGAVQSISGVAAGAEAAGLAGGAEAAAVLGGPVGIAIAAGAKGLDIAIKKSAEALRTYTEGVENAARQQSAIIGNRHQEIFMNSLDEMAKGADKVSEVHGAAFRAAVAPVKAFTEVMNAAVDRAKQLERYNGAIAAANAQAEMRGMMADVREAQTTGKQLARIAEAQSRLDNTVRELLLPIKNVLYGVVAQVLEGLSEKGEMGLEVLKDLLKNATLHTDDAGIDARFGGGRNIDTMPMDDLRRMLMQRITVGGGAPAGIPPRLPPLGMPVGGP